MTLAIACVEWTSGMSRAIPGQRTDLTGEPVVGVHHVVVTDRLGRLVAGEDTQLSGKSPLVSPSQRLPPTRRADTLCGLDDRRQRRGRWPA